MTAKDIHIALKREDGINYLIERFGFSSEEELLEAIPKASPGNAKRFIRSLKKIQKGRTKVVKADDEISRSIFEEQIETNEEQDVVVLTNIRKDDLERLQAEEKELSNKICSIEGEHKELLSKRRNIIFRLARAKNALAELKRLLSWQEENVANLYTEYGTCATKMEQLNKEKRDYQTWLDNVRNMISALKKVTIFVYEDGTIEIENAEKPTLLDGEFLAELGKLNSCPEVEELTIKEIKSIAKLRLIVKSFKDNAEPDLVIDNPKIQSAVEKLIP